MLHWSFRRALHPVYPVWQNFSFAVKTGHLRTLGWWRTWEKILVSRSFPLKTAHFYELRRTVLALPAPAVQPLSVPLRSVGACRVPSRCSAGPPCACGPAASLYTPGHPGVRSIRPALPGGISSFAVKSGHFRAFSPVWIPATRFHRDGLGRGKVSAFLATGRAVAPPGNLSFRSFSPYPGLGLAVSAPLHRSPHRSNRFPCRYDTLRGPGLERSKCQ